MNIIKTELNDCYIIEPNKFGDNRGWFMESYNKNTFKYLYPNEILIYIYILQVGY